MRTTTTIYGSFEHPLDAAQLAVTAGANYVAMWTTSHPKQLKEAIKKAVQTKGFRFIEAVSQCPTAVYNGKNVVQTQSYGAEARGTMAKSDVIISEGKIGFPAVRKCDILIAMSQEALDKNIQDLKENGLLLVDNSLITNIPQVKAKLYAIPATELSEKTFGQKTYANMIMLGALTKITKLVSWGSVEKAVKDNVVEKTAAANLQAYKRGIELIA